MQLTRGDRTGAFVRKLSLLIVDEVAMLHRHVIEAIDLSFRDTRREPHIAFGGVVVLLCGDPAELPVVARGESVRDVGDVVPVVAAVRRQRLPFTEKHAHAAHAVCWVNRSAATTCVLGMARLTWIYSNWAAGHQVGRAARVPHRGAGSIVRACCTVWSATR